MSTFWTFLLIWGVWLITPVIVDGFETLGRLVVVRRQRASKRADAEVSDDELPTLAIVVPCHNEAAVIDRCINSLKAQDYPTEKLEVVIVDDGSTDDTAERVERHVSGDACAGSFLLRGEPIAVGPFRGRLALIRNGHAGKAHALNAGIASTDAEIVVNVDSDVVLTPQTARRIGEFFVRNPETAAATGNIEIDWDIVEKRDEDGMLVLDENGDLVPAELSAMRRFLAKSQFLEYLSSFDMGRRAQAVTSTMYSLAGACSAFRRSLFAEECAYSNETVSEDTHLTFKLHERKARIGYMHEARVHLEPVVDWDELYAQRVRWARGQLEVCGVHEDLIGSKEHGAFGTFALEKMLLLDHTLAFPRLVWMPLILCFPFIGYSWRILAIALAAMYLFYLLLEIVNVLAAYSIADDETKERIEHSQVALLGLPIYRFVVFHYRFSGFLVTLTERQQWTMRGPLESARSDAGHLRLRSIQLLTSGFGVLSASSVRVARACASAIAPTVVLLSVIVTSLQWWRKSA